MASPDKKPTRRKRCVGCGKRRKAVKYWLVGGSLGGIIYPVCAECLSGGWIPWDQMPDYYEEEPGG